MILQVPGGVTAELWLDERERIQLTPVRKENGMAVYLLTPGTVWRQVLMFT
jgi:hypothetical protein